MKNDYQNVPAVAKAVFRMVSGPESLPMYQAGMGDETARLREAMLAQSRLPEAVAQFFVEMDKKLDMILSAMQRGTLEENFPCSGRIVSISGARCTLACKEALAPGDFLELVVFLSEYPFVGASAIARVDSIQGRAPLDMPGYSAYELSYHTIQADDKDAIIKYVFQEDRRRIRTEKLGE